MNVYSTLLASLLGLVLVLPTSWAETIVTKCSGDDVLEHPTERGFSLQAAVRIRGGDIYLRCPPGTRMRLSKTLFIDRPTMIDGGGTVTLDGELLRPGVIVNQKHRVSLRNIALTRMANPGSLFPEGNVVKSGGEVELIDVTITNSSQPVSAATVNMLRSTLRENGGIQVWSGDIRIAESLFVNNNGPAFSNWFRVAAAPATIERTIFQNNHASTWIGEIAINKSRFVGHRLPQVSETAGALILNGNAEITMSTFANNQGKKGGAIELVAGTLQIRRSHFTANQSVGTGGAIFVSKSAQHPTLGTINNPSRLSIAYSHFIDNASGSNGGAIGFGDTNDVGRSAQFSANVVMFAKNKASTSAGGAVYSGDAPVTISRAIFLDNEATDGSAFATGPRPSARVALFNSLVSRNRAANGAALAANFAEIVNTTVTNNEGYGLSPREYWPTAVSPLDRSIELSNSLINQNSRENCFSLTDAREYINRGGNLQFPSRSCGNTIDAIDPLLDSFFIPSPLSPARGAADMKVCLGDKIRARDVYNGVRPRGNACASGAVEADIEQKALRKLHRTHELEIPTELRPLKAMLERWREGFQGQDR